MAYTKRHDGSYILRVLPDVALYVEPADNRWSARLGSERIPETFATADDAQRAGNELARRRLYEALALVTFTNA